MIFNAVSFGRLVYPYHLSLSLNLFLTLFPRMKLFKIVWWLSFIMSILFKFLQLWLTIPLHWDRISRSTRFGAQDSNLINYLTLTNFAPLGILNNDWRFYLFWNFRILLWHFWRYSFQTYGTFRCWGSLLFSINIIWEWALLREHLPSGLVRRCAK